MKRLSIICLLVLQTWMVRADYTPFVVEGKTWMTESQNGGSTSVLSCTYVLSGDTLINNILYKKLNGEYRYDGKPFDEYIGAYREEGRKVYVIKADKTEEQLHYDFSLQVGDKFFEYGYNGDPHAYEVCLNDSFYNCGHALHRIGMGLPTVDGLITDYDWLNIWIEGVGSAWGPGHSIYFTMTGGNTRIRYCCVGDDYLYKDTLQEFVSPNLSWADGYTKNGNIYLNRHKVIGTRDVDGQTYTVMQARQYVSSQDGEVSEELTIEYLLREDPEGEAWLRMESPQQMATLYGIKWDAETADSLFNRDLYLFNTRADGWAFMTYGHLASSGGLKKNWKVEKSKVKMNSNTFVALENGNYTFQRSLPSDNVPHFLMSVGWIGYGPFYGLDGVEDGCKRFFPILYEGKNVVFHDEECMEFLRTKAPSLLDIITVNKFVTFTKCQMATVILPVEPDASKGKYYRLDRVEGKEIIFEQELQPRAHVPYIIVPNEDFSIDLNTLDLEGCSPDTVSIKIRFEGQTESQSIYFIGSYVSEELEQQEGLNIEIIDTTPDCSFSSSGETGKGAFLIGALRAYLTWDDPIDHGGAKGRGDMEIVLRDYGTSIGEIKNEQLKIKNDVFDLSGRKIVNGTPRRQSRLGSKESKNLPQGIYTKQ